MNTMLQVTRKSSTPPLSLSVSCHTTDDARPLASRASAYAGRSNFTLRGRRTRIIACTSDLRIRCEDDVYAQIREQRKAKRMAKAEKERKEKEAAVAGVTLNPNLQCQVGDMVSLGWEAVDVASGKVLTSSKNSPDGKRLDKERLLSFQMGTDAGFQPKRGLLLAFNFVTEGLKVGEKATVVSRPVGAGWLKGFEVFSEAGAMLAQLTADERREPWAGKETSFTVEVMKIEEPAGREGKGPARKLGARF